MEHLLYAVHYMFEIYRRFVEASESGKYRNGLAKNNSVTNK